MLFDEPDVLQLLEEYIAASTQPRPPRSPLHDRLIDAKYGLVELCDRTLYSSELLYAFDSELYRDLALELATPEPDAENGGAS